MTSPTKIPGTTPRQWPPPQPQSTDVHERDFSAPPPSDNVRIADFSYTPPALKFTIDGEVYECYPMISAAIAQDLANMATDRFFTSKSEIGASNVDQAMDKIAAVFRLIIKPNSIDRFIERLFSRENPLDVNKQVTPLLQWLLEQYGARPTTSSSDSSTSSATDGAGTSSTDGASNTASSLSPS